MSFSLTFFFLLKLILFFSGFVNQQTRPDVAAAAAEAAGKAAVVCVCSGGEIWVVFFDKLIFGCKRSRKRKLTHPVGPVTVSQSHRRREDGTIDT